MNDSGEFVPASDIARTYGPHRFLMLHLICVAAFMFALKLLGWLA